MLRASSCRLELGFRQDRSREFGLEPAVLELTVLSADDLRDVNMFWKMEVYAVVSISSDPRSAQKTPVDRDGGRNPRWEHPMKFTVDAVAPWAHDAALVFKLRAKSSLGDSDIGVVHVPIRDLMDDQARAPVPRVERKRPGRVVMYTVCTSSGRSKGRLEFAYKFIYDNAATGRPMFKKNLSYENVVDARTGCPSPRPENSNKPTQACSSCDYHPTRCLSLGSSHPQPGPGPFLGRNDSYHGPPIGYGYNLPQPQPYQGLSYGYPIYSPPQHWQPAGHGHGYGHPPVQLLEPPKSRDKKGREDRMPRQSTEKKGKKGKWLGLWIASGLAGGFLGGPKAAKMVKEVVEDVSGAAGELPTLKDKAEADSS